MQAKRLKLWLTELIRANGAAGSKVSGAGSVRPVPEFGYLRSNKGKIASDILELVLGVIVAVGVGVGAILVKVNALAPMSLV